MKFKLRKTPLAWLQVKREKQRLTIALAGIAFADLLMFVQLGLNETLYSSAVNLHNSLQGDLFLLNPISEALQTPQSFSRQRLYQAASFKEIASITPVYLAGAKWRNPQQLDRIQIVQTVGIDPSKSTFILPEVNQQINEIKLIDSVLFDRNSRPEFGNISTLLQQKSPLLVQVNERRVLVTGLFTLGTSFGANGTMVTSDSTFLRLFPDRQAEQIDVGLIKLEPGANRQQVQTALKAYLPKDVVVLTQEEFGAREQQYWSTNTPTGFIFGLGTIIGFIVGIVIVYQILYSDVSDHLPEYATLKAMGYSNRFLVNILIQESLILAFLGFIPGFILSSGLYVIAAQATLLPIGMTANRAVFVLSLTVVMCTVSGGIAMRKLQAADPADIF